MKKLLLSVLSCCFMVFANGQNENIQYFKFENYLQPNTRTPIQIPDILGYRVLKCDFHIHTFFSDGEVSPSTRVNEAWREGLDAIAITEHNKPKDDFLNADFNKSYELAKERGDEVGLMVIEAAEYTDKDPVGHLNFLFIDDANQYDRKKIEPEAAVELAASKGAFIIYNHPGWPDGNSDLSDFHKKFIANRKIRAIEVFNEAEFYPQVIDFCLDNNLAPVGCSDIHAAIGFDYNLAINRRPMTLVLAKEATLDGIKEALFAGRTLAWSNNILAGKEEYIRELFYKSLIINKISEDAKRIVFNITNQSDINYLLEAEGKITVLPAGKIAQLSMKKTDLSRTYQLKNCFSGARKNVSVSLPLIINK